MHAKKTIQEICPGSHSCDSSRHCYTTKPLDGITWGVLSGAIQGQRATDLLATAHTFEDTDQHYNGTFFDGYMFAKADNTGVQFEATGSMTLVLALDEHYTPKESVNRTQTTFYNSYPCMPATIPHNLADSTYGWSYYPLYHIAATAWTSFSYHGINPFV